SRSTQGPHMRTDPVGAGTFSGFGCLTSAGTPPRLHLLIPEPNLAGLSAGQSLSGDEQHRVDKRWQLMAINVRPARHTTFGKGDGSHVGAPCGAVENHLIDRVDAGGVLGALGWNGPCRTVSRRDPRDAGKPSAIG